MKPLANPTNHRREAVKLAAVCEGAIAHVSHALANGGIPNVMMGKLGPGPWVIDTPEQLKAELDCLQVGARTKNHLEKAFSLKLACIDMSISLSL